MTRGTIICVLLTITAVMSRPCAAADDLTQQALRLLEHRCLSCHNDLDRAGEVSLETQAGVLDTGLIEPGDASVSHLLSVISETDGEPPSMPKDSDPLTSDEQKLLRTWIEQGAAWPEGYRLQQPAADNFDWWSLQPLQRPPVPQFEPDSAVASWIQTPIDAFVAAAHREHELTPAPQADRRTLVRRLYFDLTGLPPTPDEVEQFVHEQDPHAWDRLIDRLLASERYGERWARHWLDVAKYADTCGYDKDKLRPNAWPYRDYVIRSFNEDKPYTQFVQEQIAGDVLFPDQPDGIVALGFIAAGPWDFIGHAEVPESKIDGQVARNLDRDDMVSNTLNSFCSVTIQCARCHNHKFDPFTQEHYYSLQSVFAAVDKADRPWDADPRLRDQRTALSQQISSVTQQLQQLRTTIQQRGGDELAAAEQQLKDLQKQKNSVNRPPQYGYHSQIAQDPDTVKWVEVDLGKSVTLSEIRLRACSDDFAGIGAGFGFPLRFRVEGSTSPISDGALLLGDHQSDDVPNPRLNGFRIPFTPQPVRYIRVSAVRLAERQDDFIFALSELEAVDADGKNVALGAAVTSLDSIEAPQRWRRSNLTDGLFPQHSDPETAVRLTQAESRLQQLMNTLLTPEIQSRQQQLRQQQEALTDQLNKLPPQQMVYAATSDFKAQSNFKPTNGKPRTVRVLHRGNVTQPLHEVSPGVIPLAPDSAWELPLNADHTEGERRAALARWLTDPDNPLTWRSIVNRVWQYHFGQAIVASPNDFGRMGQLPTHPHLLDWLATEFRDNGQSFRHLHRLILRSAVWKQASQHHAANAAIDGSNQYLWRQSRRRLSAEELRDSVLAVSGRLNLEMGGPGYYLFALEKTDHSPHYEYHKFDPADEASHRRSVYRFIVRSQPDPFMTTMDCADSSQSTPRRTETFTPLQALSLMNNRFTIVMAEAFSERLQQDDRSLSESVELAFQLCTGRSPSETEHQAMNQYAARHGITALARLMFNLNEFVFVD